LPVIIIGFSISIGQRDLLSCSLTFMSLNEQPMLTFENHSLFNVFITKNSNLN
jgi:hypothetical protein